MYFKVAALLDFEKCLNVEKFECDTHLNVNFHSPGNLLLVLRLGVPHAQLTGQSLHALFRFEQVAQDALQVVLQRSGRGRRGGGVGRFRCFGGRHHHDHLRLFGRVQTDEFLPPLPQRLQQQSGRYEHWQREHDHGERYDNEFQHQRFDGQQNGNFGQKQRGYSRYDGLDQPEFGRAAGLEQIGQYVVSERRWASHRRRCEQNGSTVFVEEKLYCKKI